MPRVSFAGHPLHPQLIVAPAGILPFSSVMDVLAVITDRDDFATTAYYGMVGGCLSAVAAGVAGTVDYLAIPAQTEVKRTANVHALLNIGVLGVYGASLLLRRNRSDRRARILASTLSTLGAAGLLVSAWYGGHLVYHHGVRVKDISPIEDARNLKLRNDATLDKGLQEAERFFPASGPAA